MSNREFLIDYHVHSTFSCDAESTITEHCFQAMQLGLAEIGFCEHADFEPSDEGTGFLDWPAYSEAIAEAKAEFAGRLTVRKSIEMCYQLSTLDCLTSFFDDKTDDLDYLIGSVHWIDHKRMNEDFFGDKSEEEAYNEYFTNVLALIESGYFDVLGHLELVKRYGADYYGPFQFEKYREPVSAVLETLIKQDMALEVNTSGLRQAPREPYPSFQTIRLYHDLGGKLITVGSDSHSTSSIAAGIPEALDMLRAIGYKSITVYVRRQPGQVSIV